ADEVADRVAPHLESRRLHPVHQARAPCHVFARIREARDAALRRAPNLRQLFDLGGEAAGIYLIEQGVGWRTHGEMAQTESLGRSDAAQGNRAQDEYRWDVLVGKQRACPLDPRSSPSATITRPRCMVSWT